MIEVFKSIGLTEAKAKETVKNVNLAKNLEEAIIQARKAKAVITASEGVLLYHVSSKIKPQIRHRLGFLVDHVVAGKLDTELRVNTALEYLLSRPDEKELDVEALDKACGVGVIVTPEQIEKEVEEAIEKVKNDLISKRYRFPLGQLMGNVRKALPWADGKAVKSEIDVQILDLLGPKTDSDLAPPAKKEKVKQPKESKKDNGGKKVSANDDDIEGDGAATIAELMRNKVHFHKPGENFKTDGYTITDATMDRLAAHLKRTDGKVRTRFPPEPNGILHIGHAKAININFGYAAAHNGVCFLRYDDTNPEKEEEKFFTGIKDMVEWLGYKPFKITHSSDYFDQLYNWAVDLIKKDLAYVCHQKLEDMRGFNPPPSPWRTRPIKESLRLFEDMKNGKFDEGEATLRLKVTLEEGKQDPVAYRIKYAAHHKTGDQW